MSRKRRGRGEGSIYKRKDGLWCGILTIGWSPEGKQMRRYIYRTEKAAVLDALDKLRADLRSGLPIDPTRMVVSDFLARWLQDVARVRVRPSTYRRYQGLIRLYVLPRLGGVPLGHVAPVHIQNVLAALEEQQKSRRLCQMVYATMHTALQRAVKWNLISRNPCDAVEKPRVVYPEMKTWS